MLNKYRRKTVCKRDKVFRRQAALISIILSTIIAAIASDCAFGQTPPSLLQDRVRAANENEVTIVASGAGTSYTRFAEDIQNVLDDPEHLNGLRVLPVLGRGGVLNIADILLVRNIDMAIVDAGDIALGKETDPVLFAATDKTIQYVAKLATSEFTIIGRPEIKRVVDLKGKKVNCLKKMSSTDRACRTLFKLLGIEVEIVYFDQELAVSKLKSAEIAGVARIGAAPYGTNDLKLSDGYHFVPVDQGDFQPSNYVALLDSYSPVFLTSELFPQLVEPAKPVPTIAGSMLLVTYGWAPGTERYLRVARFVNAFFDKIEAFKTAGRHRKWKEINLATNVPGWVRFKPAQDWLDGRKQRLEKSREEMRAALAAFLKTQDIGNIMTEQERNAQISKFLEWMQTQTAKVER